ncbi:MAG: hypothetical protein JRJ45_10280 [Deltaproteobacteria bacterium]|nr:hypothetical protein [Deltaproteobacteria bacterium]
MLRCPSEKNEAAENKNQDHGEQGPDHRRSQGFKAEVDKGENHKRDGRKAGKGVRLILRDKLHVK